jgi:hypothetical protein
MPALLTRTSDRQPELLLGGRQQRRRRPGLGHVAAHRGGAAAGGADLGGDRLGGRLA